MTGILTIAAGSPNWYLSPDIWVTPVGASSTAAPGVTPIAGQAYDVWVQVHDNYNESVPSGSWDLFVCWAIPTTGPIPIPPASQILNNAPIGVPVSAMGHAVLKAAKAWTPVFENGGHECLVALVFSIGAGLGLPPSLDGDPSTQDTEQGTYSVAQHNLGVLPVGSHMRPPRRFHYAFQVCNGADEEREFVVRAEQAPLSEIRHFLPSVPGGRAVLDKPGKVERLGIVGSAKPELKELEAAPAVLSRVRIAPRSCRAFTLGGSLERGNALINVTQSHGERVVGGLSVLVMAEAK